MDDKHKAQISAVILAAGQGSRMQAGINKQYLYIDDKPLLSYTLDAFESSDVIDEIILVINPAELETCREEVLVPGNYHKVRLADGGARRQDSVYSGLCRCAEGTDIVLIHDGARPIISDELIQNCVDETAVYHATAVGVPEKNTIKVIGKDGFVERTPDRSVLYAIQTPQSFDYDLILQAHKKAEEDGFTGTDDASLVERLPHPVKIIKGDYSNIKITTPEDLIIAESIIANRRQNQ